MRKFLGFKRNLVVLHFVLLLVSCGMQGESGSDTADLVGGGERFVEAGRLWNAYLQELKQESPSLQPGCEPRIMPRAQGVAYRGSVMLLHGFSPCPQQYFELAEMLTGAGYDVYLPLLPGHGRSVLPNNRDDHSRLPTLADWNRYEDFARQMNTIMAALPGQRVLGGLSLGGAIAARAAGLASSQPYDRVLLLTPYFGHPRPEIRAVLSSLRSTWEVPALGHLAQRAGETYTGWGNNCVKERGLGRAGYCDFELKHILAIEEFGSAALENIGLLNAPVQFVRIDGDNGASFELMGRAAQTIKQNGYLAGDVVYPKNSGVNHSLLSRFDSPSEDKYWIDSLEKALVEFIVEGFPVSLDKLDVRSSR